MCYGTQALDELSDFIKYAHPRMKDHQKLLRNLMILEMLKRVLDKFDPDSQHARYSHVSVCIWGLCILPLQCL